MPPFPPHLFLATQQPADEPIPIPSPLRRPIPVLAVVVLISIRHPVVSSDEISVFSHPSKLQLPLGQPVDSSPGSRPGAVATCNRAHIHGLSRLRHPTKFAHSLKVRVSVTQGDAIFRIQTIELCFHRNASLGVGMCPAAEWQMLSNESWVRSMSPYGHRILDIRMLPDPSRSIQLSTEQEFLFHRPVLLLLGVAMMIAAHAVSESVVFSIIITLNKGMRLLPIGRRSSLAIIMYSSIVGVSTFLLRCLSGLLCSMLVEMGISKVLHNPLGIFLLVCLDLAGAWFGYWGVRKLVLTEDGLVDSSVAYFVKWAIMIFSAVMILQSSVDTLLAAEALVFVIILFMLVMHMIRTLGQSSPCNSPVLGGGENYYSTFHDIPERKSFSKEEWKMFTGEQTEAALRGLLSSPKFHEWAVDNAERITVTRPEKDSPGFREWVVANAEWIMVTPP